MVVKNLWGFIKLILKKLKVNRVDKFWISSLLSLSFSLLSSPLFSLLSVLFSLPSPLSDPFTLSFLTFTCSLLFLFLFFSLVFLLSSPPGPLIFLFPIFIFIPIHQHNLHMHVECSYFINFVMSFHPAFVTPRLYTILSAGWLTLTTQRCHVHDQLSTTLSQSRALPGEYACIAWLFERKMFTHYFP